MMKNGFHNFLMKPLVFIFYLLVFMCFSCKQRSDYLKDALFLAGNNRPELEKVLVHYKKNPEDSLKYKAAIFLIENMPGHYSYKHQDYLQAYYDELYNSVSLDYDNEVNKRIIEEISAKYNDNRVKEIIQDIQTITAQYIIDNIERSFQIWQEGEWATHVSFDDFCEYILPYKGSELQAFDDWREYAHDMQSGNIKLLNYCDLYKNLTFQAATSVSQEIIDINQQDYPSGGINSIPIKDIRTIAKMPFGSCSDYVFFALSVMRSKGIPVMEDFTPQWPFQASGHSWSVVLDNSGKNVIFSPGTSNPGELHKPDEKMAKVFRRQYAINREIVDIHLSEQSIPSTFRNFSIRDVTDEYMVTSDVEIEIPPAFRNKYRYSYLAVFNNRNWVPIQYGKTNGKKVQFTSMGRNCMYLPVFYDDNRIVPFSSPFYITPLGEIQRCDADTTQTTTLNIYRKYFIAKHCYDVGSRMQGGKFEAANRADFSDSVLIYEIPNLTVQSGMVRTDTIDTAYRYWRYLSADSCYSNVAELYFYQSNNNKPIYGEIIGTKGSYNNHPIWTREAVFDNDPLTFFDAPEPNGSWVGMDFGKPIKISQVSYTPRGDGNDITPGDVHECLYWFDNQWVSLGKRVANDIVLRYENVPVNTIYWIRNLSRGKDERIFTYENGKQRWW
jgi:F5/8 type C domain.